MLEAIIFDMDGVIIDSEPLHDQTSIQVAKNTGNVDLEALQEDLDAFRGRGEMDFWGHVKNRHNLTPSIEELVKMKQEEFIPLVSSNSNVDCIDGVRELTESLHRLYPMALASSSAHAVIRAILHRLKMEGLFNVAVSGDDVENGKPAPDIFLHTAKQLNVKPDNCAVIEDSENGVAAAKAAGMVCVGFKGIEHNTANLEAADLVISSYEELNADTLSSLFQISS